MSRYAIDKDVPLPDGEAKYPELADIKDLEVGDSFFVEGAKRGEFRRHHAIGRLHGIFLRTEHFDSDPIYMKKGVRVWRVDPPPPPEEPDDDL